MKSSAASISVTPVDDGREAMAMRPSTFPVLMKTGAPAIGIASTIGAKRLTILLCILSSKSKVLEQRNGNA
jgi:hypothetical protein